MPITFVSDCSIEKYTVASEMEQSSKHEQSKCIPVTFISDSIVDLVKTQGPKNDKYCETESLKRLELTPNKQGYTPERHPTKKQKPNFARWTNEILTTEKPKSKSFKEMIDALHKSIYNTSDSDDDFDQAFQPLNTDTTLIHSMNLQNVKNNVWKSNLIYLTHLITLTNFKW